MLSVCICLSVLGVSSTGASLLCDLSFSVKKDVNLIKQWHQQLINIRKKQKKNLKSKYALPLICIPCTCADPESFVRGGPTLQL